MSKFSVSEPLSHVEEDTVSECCMQSFAESKDFPSLQKNTGKRKQANKRMKCDYCLMWEKVILFGEMFLAEHME